MNQHFAVWTNGRGKETGDSFLKSSGRAPAGQPGTHTQLFFLAFTLTHQSQLSRLITQKSWKMVMKSLYFGRASFSSKLWEPVDPVSLVCLSSSRQCMAQPGQVQPASWNAPVQNLDPQSPGWPLEFGLSSVAVLAHSVNPRGLVSQSHCQLSLNIDCHLLMLSVTHSSSHTFSFLTVPRCAVRRGCCRPVRPGWKIFRVGPSTHGCRRDVYCACGWAWSRGLQTHYRPCGTGEITEPMMSKHAQIRTNTW